MEPEKSVLPHEKVRKYQLFSMNNKKTIDDFIKTIQPKWHKIFPTFDEIIFIEKWLPSEFNEHVGGFQTWIPPHIYRNNRITK